MCAAFASSFCKIYDTDKAFSANFLYKTLQRRYPMGQTCTEYVLVSDGLFDGKKYQKCSSLTSYVCVCQSVVQRAIWTPPSSSLRLAPPLPGGNGCSGSLVLYGSCSASHRLRQRTGVQTDDWLHFTTVHPPSPQ